MAYGQNFTVGVGNFEGGEIDKIVLVRLPSVTHQFAQDQRRIELSFKKPANDATPNEKTKIVVTAPKGGFILFQDNDYRRV